METTQLARWLFNFYVISFTRKLSNFFSPHFLRNILYFLERLSRISLKIESQFRFRFDQDFSNFLCVLNHPRRAILKYFSRCKHDWKESTSIDINTATSIFLNCLVITRRSRTMIDLNRDSHVNFMRNRSAYILITRNRITRARVFSPRTMKLRVFKARRKISQDAIWTARLAAAGD